MNKYAHMAPTREDFAQRHSVVHGCKAKARYNTENVAIEVARRRHALVGVKLSPYYCGMCDGYHLSKRSGVQV